VPPRGLPGNANLEQLRNGAKSFQRAVRAGDAGAAEIVREFHPRFPDAPPGSPQLDGFTRADAQLVVARSFNFPSWPKLKTYLETVSAYARSPHEQPVGGPLDTEAERADEFLRLACLNYGNDDPARRQRAAELLAAHPELASAGIYTAAAAGDAEAVSRFLTGDPSAANLPGGPFDWAPLLYVTYSRVGDRPLGAAAVQVARLLLDAGADPNQPFDAGLLGESHAPSPPVPPLSAAIELEAGPELTGLLLQYGAAPDVQGPDGRTPYQQAVRTGQARSQTCSPATAPAPRCLPPMSSWPPAAAPTAPPPRQPSPPPRT
jgi:hypothetical protein